MTNSTCTDVIFEGAWCNGIVGKQEHCHSTAPADKQINELLRQTPSNNPLLKLEIRIIDYRMKLASYTKPYYRDFLLLIADITEN